MRQHRLEQVLSILIVSAFLAACGGGGGGGSTSTPPVTSNPDPAPTPTPAPQPEPEEIAGVSPPEGVSVVTATNAN